METDVLHIHLLLHHLVLSNKCIFISLFYKKGHLLYLKNKLDIWDKSVDEKLPYVKYVASGNLLCVSGNSNQGFVTT